MQVSHKTRMNTSEYLFPARLTRRDFIKMGSLATAALAAPGLASAGEGGPVRFGEGKFTYTLDENWGRLPQGMEYGKGCGIAVDAQDRIYATSRSESPCVAVFDPQGKVLETWSNEFASKVGYTVPQVADTAHGLYWSKEGDEEFLYFTENKSTNKEGPQMGKRVYKTDLNGKVLYTIGNVDKETSTSQKFEWMSPTDVAVAPNGDIYVVDGYGSQRVSRFDKNFKHLKTIGMPTDTKQRGPNAPHGTFSTCHGVWVNTLKKEPELYIADRNNHRVEIYSLDFQYKRTLAGSWLRAPCCFYQSGGHIFIPDLSAQVVVLDADDNVVARLGDGAKVPKAEKDKRPEFIAPHALTLDSKGNLYVLEWVPYGRVRKFTKTAV